MNKVMLLGRLTKDPETRYTQTNNTAVCNFTLAVNRRFDKDKADFINCQAWQKTAEFASKHFAKGMQIAVVGRIQTRTWDDNDGKRHYVTEVVVDEVYFVDSKKQNEDTGNFEPIDEDDELPF